MNRCEVTAKKIRLLALYEVFLPLFLSLLCHPKLYLGTQLFDQPLYNSRIYCFSLLYYISRSKYINIVLSSL